MTKDDLTIERIPHSGVIIISAIVNGFREVNQYYDYTEDEAAELFFESYCR